MDPFTEKYRQSGTAETLFGRPASFFRAVSRYNNQHIWNPVWSKVSVASVRPCHFLQASRQLPQLPFARQRRRFGEGRFLPRQGRQRGLLVHGGNGAIEPQIVRYTRKAPGFEDCGKTAVAAQECGGAERADARRSRQFVGRIAAQRDEVRYLFRLDAVALAHCSGPIRAISPARSG